ncbi:MAG: hypothetical protein E7639_02945 [Ruminococcaceae bacterium]|nr:hypothetical protein [Oscillospiraceae bacterium]
MALKKRERSLPSPEKGKGVRGSVAYRELSDSVISDVQYNKWLFITVNVVLVLFALAVTGIICWHFAVPDTRRSAGYEDKEIYYTLEFYDMSGAMATAPAVGTSLIDPATGAVLGEITAVYAEPATVNAVVWQDGWQTLPENAVTSTLPLPAQIVSVTVRATVAYKEGQGYTKNGVRLAMGEAYTVLFSGTLASGVCTAMLKGES